MSRFDPISQVIQNAVKQYFTDLEGEEPSFVYDMVIAKVEKPLLETVLHYTVDNQTRASKILGLNRNTLRKKLKEYDLD